MLGSAGSGCRPEQVASHNDGVVAVSDGLVDGIDTSLIGILSGLVVGAVNGVLFCEGGDAFIGVLVEGVVVDVADVGHESDLHAGINSAFITGGLSGLAGFGRFGRRLSGGLGRSLSGGLLVVAGAAGEQASDHCKGKKKCYKFLHFLNLHIDYVAAFTAC